MAEPLIPHNHQRPNWPEKRRVYCGNCDRSIKSPAYPAGTGRDSRSL